MTISLRKRFVQEMKQRLTPLGYDRHSNAFFARRISINTLACTGFLISFQDPIWAKRLAGIRFEHVERLVGELDAPFITVPNSSSAYFPTIWQDVFQLAAEDPVGTTVSKPIPSYIKIERDELSDACQTLLSQYLDYGWPNIETNTQLETAAATMLRGKGGGIGSISRSLPVILWMLGRVGEAKDYMADIASKNYPIGDYAGYAKLLTARMNAGPAPLPHNVN